MITTTLTAVSGNSPAPPNCRAAGDASAARRPLDGSPAAAYWVEPGTDRVYPLSYCAYQRTREAEEKTPPRHRTLGPDVDHYVWRRGLSLTTPEVEVSLTVRSDAPPRIRRIVGEVLLAIRRGRPAGDAIRHVSRRFGLRQTRARAFITASIGFEVRVPQDAIASFAPAHWPTTLVI
jgi:hypothetical protein